MIKIKEKKRNNEINKYNEIAIKKSSNKYNMIRKYYSETKLLIKNNKKLSKKSNINKYRLIIICSIIIFIIFFIILRKIYFTNASIIDNKYEDEDENFEPDNETIYYEEKFDSYIEAFNKSKDFINMNIKGILLNTIKFNLLKKPELTIIIPCYNCHNYILRCIRSIQNQNFSNFEIIIVDDASSNETILYLEQLQKEDQRIKIINNKKNMGILYSRAVGTFSSKARYIFTMDGDDMYLDENVLSSIINIAYKGNFDIIIFNSIVTDLKPDVYTTKITTSFLEVNHKPNLVLFQPNLGNFTISPSDDIENPSINEVLIHPKCIKTKIYQRALTKLGIERYSRHMLSGEDDIANYIIFNTAKVAKFVPRYGYLYISNKESTSKTVNDRVKHAICLIYIYDAMIDFSLNLVSNKKVLVNYIIFIFKNSYLKDALNSNEYNHNLFISCLDRVFNCSLISDEYKNEIRKRGKELDFIKYNFSTIK